MYHTSTELKTTGFNSPHHIVNVREIYCQINVQSTVMPHFKTTYIQYLLVPDLGQILLND